MNNRLMTHSEVKKKIFDKDPKVLLEYETLRPRYELISKAIDTRLKKKMTQEEVAQKMGTTKSSISRFESGDYNPTIDFLIRLSEALGKTLKINLV